MAYKKQIEKPVGSIPKGDDSRIEAKVVKKGDDLFFDIREFVTNDRYDGPTKKGIRLHSENFENFKALVEKIEAALNAL